MWNLGRNLVVAALGLVVLSAFVAPAAAEVGPGHAMITVSGSYALGKLEANQELVEGAALNMALDVFTRTKPISFLVVLSWAQMTRQDAESDGLFERRVHASPLLFGAKFWLGPRRFKLNAGAALGIWFGSLRTTLDGQEVARVADEGFGLSVPVGLSISITRGTNINAGYTLHVFEDNSFLTDNILHSVNVGFGFSWSG